MNRNDQRSVIWAFAQKRTRFSSKVFFITLVVILVLIALYTLIHIIRVHKKYLRKNTEDSNDN